MIILSYLPHALAPICEEIVSLLHCHGHIFSVGSCGHIPPIFSLPLFKHICSPGLVYGWHILCIAGQLGMYCTRGGNCVY